MPAETSRVHHDDSAPRVSVLLIGAPKPPVDRLASPGGPNGDPDTLVILGGAKLPKAEVH